MASSSFSIFPVNPGAIKLTTTGMKSSARRTKNNKNNNNKLKTSFANLFDFLLPLTSSEV